MYSYRQGSPLARVYYSCHDISFSPSVADIARMLLYYKCEVLYDVCTMKVGKEVGALRRNMRDDGTDDKDDHGTEVWVEVAVDSTILMAFQQTVGP